MYRLENGAMDAALAELRTSYRVFAPKKVRGVAEEFVSVFMNQIMKSMRATVDQNPAMHGDNGEKFFQDMLDSEYSKSMAKGSGYGLTDLIYESMMTSYRMRGQGAGAE